MYIKRSRGWEMPERLATPESATADFAVDVTGISFAAP